MAFTGESKRDLG